MWSKTTWMGCPTVLWSMIVFHEPLPVFILGHCYGTGEHITTLNKMNVMWSTLSVPGPRREAALLYTSPDTQAGFLSWTGSEPELNHGFFCFLQVGSYASPRQEEFPLQHNVMYEKYIQLTLCYNYSTLYKAWFFLLHCLPCLFWWVLESLNHCRSSQHKSYHIYLRTTLTDNFIFFALLSFLLGWQHFMDLN